MSKQPLELQFQESEEKRLASERAIEANIRFKEAIEAMKQDIHSMQVNIDTLNRRMTEWFNKYGNLQHEALQKLIKYLDDWK